MSRIMAHIDQYNADAKIHCLEVQNDELTKRLAAANKIIAELVAAMAEAHNALMEVQYQLNASMSESLEKQVKQSLAKIEGTGGKNEQSNLR